MSMCCLFSYFESSSLVIPSHIYKISIFKFPWFASLFLNVSYICHIAVSEIHGRTFGVWTLLTCTLCFLCAFNLDNKPLYLATFLSFIYALGHFLTEHLIYHTMAIGNLTTVSIFAGNFGYKLTMISVIPVLYHHFVVGFWIICLFCSYSGALFLVAHALFAVLSVRYNICVFTFDILFSWYRTVVDYVMNICD